MLAPKNPRISLCFILLPTKNQHNLGGWPCAARHGYQNFGDQECARYYRRPSAALISGLGLLCRSAAEQTHGTSPEWETHTFRFRWRDQRWGEGEGGEGKAIGVFDMTWHVATNHITSPHVTSPRNQPHDIKTGHITTTAHHHHAMAERWCTQKNRFGHRTGSCPCAHSIGGKLFLCF